MALAMQSRMLSEVIMSLLNNKIEMTLAVTVATALGSMFYFMASFKTSKGHQAENINYEMAKSKSSFQSEFDLGQRDIEYSYSNAFYKKNPASKDKNTVTTKVQKTAQAAALAKSKSAADAKAPASRVATNLTSNSQKNITKDPRTQFRAEPDSILNSDQIHQQLISEQQKVETDKKTNQKANVSQLKSLIFSQPTKAVADQLVEAYVSNDIDSVSFYQIITSLLKSQRDDTQAAGVYMASKTPSEQSFAVLVHGLSFLNGGSKTKAESALLNYYQRNFFGIMTNLLKSKDQLVVTKASSVLAEGLLISKNATGGHQPTGLASGTFTKFFSYFAKFIPQLQKLTQDSDEQVALSAQSTLVQIQNEFASF